LRNGQEGAKSGRGEVGRALRVVCYRVRVMEPSLRRHWRATSRKSGRVRDDWPEAAARKLE
jgi:hypothetical protein